MELPKKCPYCKEPVNYLNHKFHMYLACIKDVTRFEGRLTEILVIKSRSIK